MSTIVACLGCGKMHPVSRAARAPGATLTCTCGALVSLSPSAFDDSQAMSVSVPLRARAFRNPLEQLRMDLGLSAGGMGLARLLPPRVRSAHFWTLLLTLEPWPLLLNAAAVCAGFGIVRGMAALGGIAGESERLLGLLVGLALAMPLVGICLSATAIGREQQLHGHGRARIDRLLTEMWRTRKSWLMSLLFSTWGALGSALVGIGVVMLCALPSRLGGGGHVAAAFLVPISVVGAILALAGLLAAVGVQLLHAMVAVGAASDQQHVRSPRVLFLRPLDVLRAHAATLVITVLILLALGFLARLGVAVWLVGVVAGTGPALGGFLGSSGVSYVLYATVLVLCSLTGGALLSYLGGAATLAHHQLVGSSDTVPIVLDEREGPVDEAATSPRLMEEAMPPAAAKRTAPPAASPSAPVPPRSQPPSGQRPILRPAPLPPRPAAAPAPAPAPAPKRLDSSPFGEEELTTDVAAIVGGATEVNPLGSRLRDPDPNRPGPTKRPDPAGRK